MSQLDGWFHKNEEYLAASLTWLRVRLMYHIQQVGNKTTVERVTDEQVQHAAATRRKCEQVQPPPALIALAHSFNLTQFEQETLLLCAAVEFDPHMAHLCAQAHENAHQSYPTFALALSLFDEPSWDVVSPERPLRYWRLVEINTSGSGTPLTGALRVDERIIDYLKGMNYLDARLRPLLIPMNLGEERRLSPSQMEISEKIVTRLQTTTGSPLSVVQLLGIDSVSKRGVAYHAVDAFGLQLYQFPLDFFPTRADELEVLIRLWQRERMLLPIALYIDIHDVVDDLFETKFASTLGHFLSRGGGGLVFVDTRDVRSNLGRIEMAFDIAKPTLQEQRANWDREIGHIAPESPALLAGQFNLNQMAIHEIATSVMEAEPHDLASALWQACGAHTRPRLDTLAQRLTSKATWDDLILPDYSMSLLRQVTEQVRLRIRIYDEWGFGRRMNRGLGIVILFAGESGTGKTMAAEVISNELRLNLYRIDLASVVSKYIGETEKNLRRLFDAAEDGGAILFFDEADALFGKRSQVRDSHDRYANIEVNYLLQRMEAYQGLAILGTNMKGDLDKAFSRRFRFIINFPLPDHEARIRLWKHIFPPETPITALDYGNLAQFELAGGSILNIALNAAFQAACNGTPVTMPIVLSGIRSEFLKSDRLINESIFEWQDR